MAFDLTSEAKCGGRAIKIERRYDGIYHEYTSKQRTGTLALQSFSDRPYQRLTFLATVFDAAKKMKKEMKWLQEPKLSNIPEIVREFNADPLCHFDFSKEDIRRNKKGFEYQVQVFKDCAAVFGIICYDFELNVGRQYVFATSQDSAKFAYALGLTEAVLLDEEGAEKLRVTIDKVEGAENNMFGLLMLYNMVYGG